MSYHIVTVLQPGVKLSIEHGFLVCKYSDGNENRIALEDVRTLIVGVPTVSFTNTCIARLLAQDSLILHCDEHFKPIGWSASLDRVVRKEVFANQLQQNEDHNQALWKKIIRQKMENQATLLDKMGVSHTLWDLMNRPLPSEANVARQYWRHYFQSIGNPQIREKQGAKSFANRALNYGYAVISTLVHRSILIYGLLPSLGIHHDFRYRSYPLVYDLMEPYRPFVDYALYEWLQTLQGEEPEEQDFKEWIRFLMKSLRLCRVKMLELKRSFKIMDAVDKSIARIATCFETQYYKSGNLEKLWLPNLEHRYRLNDSEPDPYEISLEEECLTG